MLIDHTYFAKGPRQILSSTLGSVPTSGDIVTPAELEVCRQIESYIDEYQEGYLRGVLGERAGNKVHNYLVCLDEDEDPKHMDELDAVCDRLKESFADYVFFHILRDVNTQATITGLVRLKSANTYVSPIRKQVDVWNTMVDRHRRFEEWSRTQESNILEDGMKSEMLTKINQFNL